MWHYNHAVCGSDELYHWGIKGMKWGGFVGTRTRMAP